MTKNNKKILTSVGVITPVAVLAITLPIVLNKNSDKSKIGAIFDKLKGLKNSKVYIINPSEIELDLSKKIDKDKIIEKIKNDYKLTSEDTKKLTIEGTGKVTKNEFKDIKVKITINQESKTIDFKVKIAKNENAIKLDKLIIKINDKEISIDNNIGHDLTMSDGRTKILTAIQNNLLTNKIINEEEKNALISILTNQGKISNNWLSINFNVKYGGEERTTTLKVKNKYLTKSEEQQFINDLTVSKIMENDGIKIDKNILPSTKKKDIASNNIQTYINNYISGKIKDKTNRWAVSYKKNGSNDTWVAGDDNGSLTYTIVLTKHDFQDKEIIVKYGNGSFKAKTNFWYLDFTKMEVVDAIITALGWDKTKFASENVSNPGIKANGNTITLPKEYTKTSNDIANLKIKSIGTWKIDKFYILVNDVIIINGNIEKTYKEIKLDSFKFQNWTFINGSTNSITMDGEDVSRISVWGEQMVFIDWEGVKGLTKKNTPFKGDLRNLQIDYSKLKNVVIGDVKNWSRHLNGINWDGVKELTNKNTPFKGDISSKGIIYSTLKGVDISQVTKWPDDLQGIIWDGVVGLSITNTPFKGDISKKLKIDTSSLKGVDISQVTKWPNDLRGINWDGVVGFSAANTPFQGDISNNLINSSSLKGVDISHVTKWPSDLLGVKWEGAKYKEDSDSFRALNKNVQQELKNKGTKLD